jgi:glyoxylase-like metal-dependent hydrolase (beta-lactamase superfamily II)
MESLRPLIHSAHIMFEPTFDLGPPLSCFIIDTGYCEVWHHHVIQGGPRERIECHSIAALLRHSRYGWFLWDTGYSPRILDHTVSLPFRAYRWATPFRIDPQDSVVAQLTHFNLTPRDITKVIISHFHADHIAGLQDFPIAEYVCTSKAFDDVRHLGGWGALRHAFIPALLPSDFDARAITVSILGAPTVHGLGPSYDLFGDASALLISLPGHAAGQLGLLVNTTRGILFFVADSCYLTRAIRERRDPSLLLRLVTDNWREAQMTLKKLNLFSQEFPGIIMIPSHRRVSTTLRHMLTEFSEFCHLNLLAC